jgi:hypothetical protein
MPIPTYTDRQPLSICTAEPGWRAVYIEEAGGDEPGWNSEPLIAWAVYKVTEKPCEGYIAPEHDDGNQILGVVFDGYAQAAEEMSNFWMYLAPGDPDPAPETVAAEQRQRTEHQALRDAARQRRGVSR